MLAGYHAVDEHFRTAPVERNVPALLGLLNVWYDTFLGAQIARGAAVLAVPAPLRRLPAAADHGEQRQVGARWTAPR